MARDDVVARIGEAQKEVKAFEHFGNVVNDRERAALFEVVVEVRGIGCENDPAAAGPDAGALQAGGMPADAMQGEAGSEFIIAIVKDGALGVDVADHLENVFKIEGGAKLAMAHRAARGESHFAILQMKTSKRKAIEIASVVVMEVRDNYVGNAIGIDADEAQRIDRVSKRFAAAANGRFVGEAGIEHEGGISAPSDPDEIVEVGCEFVRIGGNEVLLWVAVAKVAVADGEDFKWFDGHASPFRAVTRAAA